MKFSVTVDRDGVWIGECPTIPDRVSRLKAKKEGLGWVKCLRVRGIQRAGANAQQPLRSRLQRCFRMAPVLEWRLAA